MPSPDRNSVLGIATAGICIVCHHPLFSWLMGHDDYYSVLSVTKETVASDPEAVRRAYKQQALRSHPDKAGDDVEDIPFDVVHRAYVVLSHPDLRICYDRFGDSPVTVEEIRDVIKTMFAGMDLDTAVGIYAVVMPAPNSESKVDKMTVDELQAHLPESNRRVLSGHPAVKIAFLLVYVYILTIYSS